MVFYLSYFAGRRNNSQMSHLIIPAALLSRGTQRRPFHFLVSYFSVCVSKRYTACIRKMRRAILARSSRHLLPCDPRSSAIFQLYTIDRFPSALRKETEGGTKRRALLVKHSPAGRKLNKSALITRDLARRYT